MTNISSEEEELCLLYCIPQVEFASLSFQYTITRQQNNLHVENVNPEVTYFLVQNWHGRREIFDLVSATELQDTQRHSYLVCIPHSSAYGDRVKECSVLSFTFSVPLFPCEVGSYD